MYNFYILYMLLFSSINLFASWQDYCPCLRKSPPQIHTVIAEPVLRNVRQINNNKTAIPIFDQNGNPITKVAVTATIYIPQSIDSLSTCQNINRNPYIFFPIGYPPIR